MIKYFRNKKHRAMWRKAQSLYVIKSKKNALSKARALALRKTMDRKLEKVPKARFEAIELMAKKGDKLGAVLLLGMTVLPIVIASAIERDL